MGRHKKSIERPCMPDVKYNSKVVTKFVSRMMLDGKKATCTKIIYEAMDKLKAKTDKDPLEVLLKALDNVKPVVEVKSRRVGGATYQVPVEIRDTRREALAMRWIIDAARSRSGHGMAIHFLQNCSMHSTIQVLLSRRRKTLIRWLKQTKLLPISDGSIILLCKRHPFIRMSFFYKKTFNPIAIYFEKMYKVITYAVCIVGVSVKGL